MFCCLRNHNCDGCAKGDCEGLRQVCRGDGFTYIVIGKSASTSTIGAIGNDYEFIPYGELCDEKGFIFSIVRNPLNRLFSCWAGWTKRPGSPLYRLDERFKQNMIFEKFIDVVCSIPDDLSDEHFVSQKTLLSNKSGELIPDFVGKIESLNEDWEVIKEKTGLGDIPHLGRAGRTGGFYKSAYSTGMREKVLERYQEDFKLWYPDELKSGAWI